MLVREGKEEKKGERKKEGTEKGSKRETVLPFYTKDIWMPSIYPYIFAIHIL